MDGWVGGSWNGWVHGSVDGCVVGFVDEWLATPPTPPPPTPTNTTNTTTHQQPVTRNKQPAASTAAAMCSVVPSLPAMATSPSDSLRIVGVLPYYHASAMSIPAGIMLGIGQGVTRIGHAANIGGFERSDLCRDTRRAMRAARSASASAWWSWPSMTRLKSVWKTL